MHFKAVIFDLDGTLLDTLTDLAQSANRVLENNNFPIHPMAEYRYFVGEGLQVLIERILPIKNRSQKTIAGLCDDFREDYSQNWDNDSGLYDGIDKMLDELTNRNIILNVLSNKPHKFTKLCVSSFFKAWDFKYVLGAKDSVPKKPDPAGALDIADLLQIPPQEILYLGDTATDMQTAVRAGMYPVGALWGFRQAEELHASGAKKLVANPLDVIQLI